jgi:hypothetical protein
MQRRAQNDPARRYWHALKQSAKRRDIPFLLTLEQWRAWTAEVRFFERREGVEVRGDRLSVDRIDSRGPYAVENIQALPMRENSRVQHAERSVWVRGVQYAVSVQDHQPQAEEEDDIEQLLARL